MRPEPVSARQSTRLPGIGSHHSANPQTDEWLTPPELLQAFADIDFRFDLDPCFPLEPPPWAHLRPERTLNVIDDGLTADWAGTVWLNPPYSEAEHWIARLAGHGDGIALVFARCDTLWWFESVWPVCSGLLFLEGRLTFHRGDGTASKPGHNSGGPSVLISYGWRAAAALGAVDLPGAYVWPPEWVRRAPRRRRAQ